MAIKRIYTPKRCTAIDAASDIFNKEHKHLMAFDVMDFYLLFGSTNTTYAQRYKFSYKTNGPN